MFPMLARYWVLVSFYMCRSGWNCCYSSGGVDDDGSNRIVDWIGSGRRVVWLMASCS